MVPKNLFQVLVLLCILKLLPQTLWSPRMAPTLSLLLLASLAAAAAADLCPEPVIPNGGVAGRKADNFFMGQVKLQHIYFFTAKIENHAYNTGKPIPLEVLHYVTLEEELFFWRGSKT